MSKPTTCFNILEASKYIQETKSNCKLATYHLVTDNSKLRYEVDQYKSNVINKTNVLSYIWKMHNWSGNYENKNARKNISLKILLFLISMNNKRYC